MPKHLTLTTLLFSCAAAGACGSSTDDPTGSGGAPPVAASGGSAGVGGSSSTGAGGTGGQAQGGSANSMGGASAGSGGSAGSQMPAGGGTGGMPSAGASGSATLTGTLGALGAVQPTVSALVISNSGEMLIYMSSSAITCELLSMSRWLGSTATGSQVVEIVVPSNRVTGTVPVEDGGAEVNYAPGGMSSAYEKSADTGSVTFTTSTPNGVVEGNVTATYGSPAGNVSGTFHAEFCAGGQGY